MIQRQVLRGFLANIDMIPPLIVTFQFNPETIHDNKKVRFPNRGKKSCGNAPDKEYTGGDDRTISFDLKLHGLEQGTNAINPTALDNGISTELAKLRSFLYPKSDAWGTFGLVSEEEGRRVNSPPTCIFGYGTKILECHVTNIDITETQFNSLLAPVRADIKVTLAVIEKEGHGLYELDKQHRNMMAAMGLQNIRVF